MTQGIRRHKIKFCWYSHWSKIWSILLRLCHHNFWWWISKFCPVISVLCSVIICSNFGNNWTNFGGGVAKNRILYFSKCWLLSGWRLNVKYGDHHEETNLVNYFSKSYNHLKSKFLDWWWRCGVCSRDPNTGQVLIWTTCVSVPYFIVLLCTVHIFVDILYGPRDDHQTSCFCFGLKAPQHLSATYQTQYNMPISDKCASN